MTEVPFMELGFPLVLVDPPMVVVRGRALPDVNMRELQDTAFRMLVAKPTRLTGAEVRFIRTHERLRQVDFAGVLNMANHSVVSQWESRRDTASGMEYNTEVVLRLWMAGRCGQGQRLLALLDEDLKGLDSPEPCQPLRVRLSATA